jgi:Flp pilus assembly pilin Flp
VKLREPLREATLTEYALLLVLIAVVVIVGIKCL